MSYYGKQMLLDNFGKAGQDVLTRAHVLMFGVGGLGCAAAQQLVAMGVGCLTLVDGDTVNESNLSRQILFQDEDIGQYKVHAAYRRLKALRSSCDIRVVVSFLKNDMCETLFLGADVVVDATDNFDTKFLINAASVKYAVPLVWANAQKWEGQLAVFSGTQGVCYRCLTPRVPAVSGGACNEIGVLGAVPNIIGCMQAVETVKVLCQRAGLTQVPAPIYGELQSFSFRDGTFFKTKIPRRADCDVCGRSPEQIALPDAAVPTCGIDDQDEVVFEALKSDPDLVLLDVRELEETEYLNVPGAQVLPLSFIQREPEEAVARLKTGVTYALFCKSGMRSRVAQEILAQCSHNSCRLLILKEQAAELRALLS